MEAMEILPKNVIDKQVYQYIFAVLNILAEVENQVSKSANVFDDLFIGKLHAINVYCEKAVELINSKEGEKTS